MQTDIFNRIIESLLGMIVCRLYNLETINAYSDVRIRAFPEMANGIPIQCPFIYLNMVDDI